MNRKKPRMRKEPVRREATPFEQARDEMFQHIMRCGVIGAAAHDQKEWFDQTMEYLTERYHELSAVQLVELRILGERFAQPAQEKQAG